LGTGGVVDLGFHRANHLHKEEISGPSHRNSDQQKQTQMQGIVDIEEKAKARNVKVTICGEQYDRQSGHGPHITIDEPQNFTGKGSKDYGAPTWPFTVGPDGQAEG
jgi:hypothetical protein